MPAPTVGFSTGRIVSVPDVTEPPTGAEAFIHLTATDMPVASTGSVAGAATPPNRGKLLGLELLLESDGDITDTSVTVHLSKSVNGELQIYVGTLDIRTIHASFDSVYYGHASVTFPQPIPYVNTGRTPEAAPSSGPGASDTNRLYAYVYGSSTGGYVCNVNLFWEADMDYHV